MGNYPATAVAVDVCADNTDTMAALVTAQAVAIADGRTHTTKFCTNCGILLNASENQNRFCGNCGAQIRRDLERESWALRHISRYFSRLLSRQLRSYMLYVFCV